MTTTIYVKDLGKCAAKTDNYRAYKEGELFALYLVGREMIWNATNTGYRYSNRLEAVKVGYFSDIQNFEMAVDAAKEEMACMMAGVTA